MTENINDKQDFIGHAEVTQDLKATVELHLDKRDKQLAPDQRESLEMIFHQIGRIINGDPDDAKGWFSIAAYALLVANRLEQ